MSVRIPKVRSRVGEPVVFRSALVPPYVRKTRKLEVSLPWLYLKGISTGQMREALVALVGPEAKGLSAPVISRLKKRWEAEYKSWCRRRLDGERWVYWWADGIYSGLRADGERLCMLVLIGVNDRGEKHFLAIDDGVRESTQSWRDLLLDLKERGVDVAPELAVGDGAMGFWAALDEVYPKTRHQRCWMHKSGNTLNYLPKSVQPKAKEALHEIWMASTRADAERAFDKFVRTYRQKYPKAVDCLVKDREPLLAFYDFPAEHWIHLRTTNPIDLRHYPPPHGPREGLRHPENHARLRLQARDGRGEAVETNPRFAYLAKVVEGVKFEDGVEVGASEGYAA